MTHAHECILRSENVLVPVSEGCKNGKLRPIDAEHFQADCKLCVEHTLIKYSKSSKANLETQVELSLRHATAEQKAAAVGVSSIAIHLYFPSKNQSPKRSLI